MKPLISLSVSLILKEKQIHLMLQRPARENAVFHISCQLFFFFFLNVAESITGNIVLQKSG